MSSGESLSRIHLDAVGGIAGDMFVAALVDAFPALADDLLATLRSLRLPDGIAPRFEPHQSGAIAARRFVVGAHAPQAAPAHHHPHHDDGHACDHAHDGHHGGTHEHRAWRDIRAWLDEAPLQAPVRQHAHDMFALLAAAEAKVHGIEPEAVVFHEVGAWDSIVDFVAAAWLIETLAPQRWSWSPLPLGGGRVRTAHGMLPVPAPATTLLMRGIAVVDDGIAGERVTPTGAAILRHLGNLGAKTSSVAQPEIIAATGFGAGTRVLPGVPNVTRCIAYTAANADAPWIDEEVGTLQFELDDQTAEDLAVGLEHLRGMPGVLEVFQATLYGKKGRLTTQVQILVEACALDEVARRCFEETTTLGLRLGRALRRRLPRETVAVAAPDAVRVKLARRPDGSTTAKAEMDDLGKTDDGHARRERVRATAQECALTKAKRDDAG